MRQFKLVFMDNKEVIVKAVDLKLADNAIVFYENSQFKYIVPFSNLKYSEEQDVKQG